MDLWRIKCSNVLVKYATKFIVSYLKVFLELKVCWCGSTKFIVSGLKFLELQSFINQIVSPGWRRWEKIEARLNIILCIWDLRFLLGFSFVYVFDLTYLTRICRTCFYRRSINSLIRLIWLREKNMIAWWTKRSCLIKN